MASLTDRFIFSAFYPFNVFLKLTGVFLIQPKSKWKCRLFRLWSYFWLALCIQANIYIFIRRTRSALDLYQENNVDKQIGEFITFLFYFTSTVIDTGIHANFISSISPTFKLFLESLDPIDCNLRRPSISPYLNRVSLTGIVYLLSTVRFSIQLISQNLLIYMFIEFQLSGQLYINWLFSIVWEISNPFRPALWFATVQSLIRILADQWFAVLPVWIFAICGELVVFYFNTIVFHLKLIALSKSMAQMEGSVRKQTFEILSSLKQIYYASDLLHHRFSTMLMANCFFSLIVMLTSSYYVIEYKDKTILIPCWDGLDFLDSFIRFCLVCHASDRMREAVNINYNMRDFSLTNIIYLYSGC